MNYFALALFLICVAMVIGMIICFRGKGEAMCPCLPGPRRRTPGNILAQRFARGEIDQKEYEEKFRVLSGQPAEFTKNHHPDADQKEVSP